MVDGLISRFPLFFVFADLECKCTKGSPLKMRSRPESVVGVSAGPAVVMVAGVVGLLLLRIWGVARFCDCEERRYWEDFRTSFVNVRSTREGG